MCSHKSAEQFKNSSILGFNESYGMELAALSLTNEQRNILLSRIRVIRQPTFPVVSITLCVLWERIFSAVQAKSEYLRKVAHPDFYSPPLYNSHTISSFSLYSIPKLFKAKIPTQIKFERKYHKMRQANRIFCENLVKEANLALPKKQLSNPQKISSNSENVPPSLSTSLKTFSLELQAFHEKLFSRYDEYYNKNDKTIYSKPQIDIDQDYISIVQKMNFLMNQGAIFSNELSRLLLRVLWKCKGYNEIQDLHSYNQSRVRSRFDKESTKIILDTFFALAKIDLALGFYNKLLLHSKNDNMFQIELRLIVIKGLIKNSEFEKALDFTRQFLQTVKKINYSPNQSKKLLRRYSSLLSLYLNQNKFGLAIEMALLFHKYLPEHAQVELYNPLLKYFSSQDEARTFTLINNIVSNKMAFNSATFNILLKFFSKIGDFETVLSLIVLLQKTPNIIDLILLNSILDALSSFGYTLQVFKVYEILRNNTLDRFYYINSLDSSSKHYHQKTFSLLKMQMPDLNSEILDSKSSKCNVAHDKDIIGTVDEIIINLMSTAKNLILVSDITKTMFLAAYRSQDYNLLLNLYQDSLFLSSALPSYNFDSNYFYNYCSVLVKFNKLDENVSNIISDMDRLKIIKKDCFVTDLQKLQRDLIT
ncbi:hypothetical protein BB561_002403 [Smittium simulii]|uniref:Pentacotripeptide-repeat region of PRORP domain-containing protein n=1 Tax=Smittium simulii TaxID=133385 RepID=A0A2T9YQI6_9FUNG|nr:hypothetical protein BB561_002403 [Smittium simulii]